MKPRVVVVMHSYLEGREALCEQGLYPRHHLWGLDALAAGGWEVRLVSSAARRSLLGWLGRVTGGRLGNFAQEWGAWRRLGGADVLYVVTTTDLFWLPLLRRCGLIRAKIVAWHYVPPAPAPAWTARGWKQSALIGRGLDGVACLTERAAAHFRRRLPLARVERIDWGVDTAMFRPVEPPLDGGFFLSCGKTERDLPALIAGVTGTRHQVRLVVPQTSLAGLSLPPNVVHAAGPRTAFDDRGASYPDLIARLYAPAIAFLIPLAPHPNNASGYTNLLEAFAMGKPVVMTRTGCIDLDLEREGAGFYVEPGDPAGWARALDRLAGDPALARAMGVRARRLAERHFSCACFGERLRGFLDRVCPPVS